MEQPEYGSDTGTEPFFSKPGRQILWILTVIALAALGGFMVRSLLLPVFMANLYLNGFILFVFLIGVVACFGQVYQIITSVSWIEGFAADNPGHEFVKAPRLLAPLAAMLRSHGAGKHIGASSSRSILDSVATRIDEDRDITRYIVNLLIFLGLLGTFFGLATTVPAMVETIKSLAPQEGDSGVEVFGRLMSGLESQLGGMGTAFSSSLLGLAGSLIVGLLELFAGHGQNQFYRELEDWLSTITRLGIAPEDGENDPLTAASTSQMAGMAQGEASGLMLHMAEQMDVLQNLFAQSDASRSQVDDRLGTLADAVGQLAQRIEDEGVSTPVLLRIADGQERMIAALEAGHSDGDEDGGSHSDAESRMRLRSIDVQLLRILEEMSAGRQESQSELRADIAALTKAIRQLGGAGGPGGPGRRG
ncbi:MAG: biopolymer transporter ExbB [Rhodobacteraceae bacterium]|nr:biopolymer transporter ExbB [Paracoccaceae bacterium]